jgi:hypothetical protein
VRRKWRYTPEDANIWGRFPDGRWTELIGSWHDGRPETLWLLAASPNLLNAAKAAHKALKRMASGTIKEGELVKAFDKLEKAIAMATHDTGAIGDDE